MQQDQPDLKLRNLQRQNQASHHQAFRFIITQLLITIVLSAALLIYDTTVAYSALAGGLIATLANAWFAIKVFRVEPTVAAGTLLAMFYVGEIVKIVFTGAMFVIVFILIKPLSVVALLVAYFLVHMTPAVVNVLGRESMAKETFDSIRDKES